MSGRARELSALTALRGVAALTVLLFHVEVLFGIDGGAIGAVVSRGYLAVDLFFMLSGFVPSHVYRDRFSDDFTWSDIGSFLWARLARIYPVHVITLVLLLPLYGKPGFSGSALVENLFFMQAILAPTLTWNGGAWSICAEWYAYLLFPLLVILLLRRTRSLSAILMLAVCVAPGAVFIACYGNANIAVGPLVLARVLPEFMAGMLLYRCLTAGSFLWVWRRDATCFLCCGAIVVLAALPRTELLIIALLAALLLCCTQNCGYVGILLETRPVLFIGHISYSLYMAQAPAYYATVEIGSHGAVTSAAALRALMVAFSFALAVPISRYIEYPARAWMRARYITPNRNGFRAQPDLLATVQDSARGERRSRHLVPKRRSPASPRPGRI